MQKVFILSKPLENPAPTVLNLSKPLEKSATTVLNVSMPLEKSPPTVLDIPMGLESSATTVLRVSKDMERMDILFSWKSNSRIFENRNFLAVSVLLFRFSKLFGRKSGEGMDADEKKIEYLSSPSLKRRGWTIAAAMVG